MSLRTYPLIVHPAYLRFIEGGKDDSFLDEVDPLAVKPHMPVLSKRYDLASFLSIDALMLRSMVRNKAKHYRSFEIKKKTGGVRTIDAPRTFLKVAQWWILDTILRKAPVSLNSTGFSPGNSFIANAREHLGCRHLLNVDIRDFFPSIGYSAVFQVFRSFGYNIDVSDMLAELCTLDAKLPQGSPTSPSLSNLFMTEADRYIDSLSRRFGVDRYTRYADDLTFSSQQRIPDMFLEELQAILKVYGLALNTTKTRFMGPNQAKEVTGLILGRDDVALPRRFLNGTRGWFYSISQQPDAYVHKKHSIQGTLQLVRQVGGRGSPSVIKLGERALKAVQSAPSPVLKWEE